MPQKFRAIDAVQKNYTNKQNMKREACQLTANTINFSTVHAFVQIEDALNGHKYQTIACGAEYWFAIPTSKRTVIISGNTTGTWEGGRGSKPLTLVVNDGVRERVAPVAPFCSSRIALQLNGACGSDVGQLNISWECFSQQRTMCCAYRKTESTQRRCGEELERICVKFTTVPEKLRKYVSPRCDSLDERQ